MEKFVLIDGNSLVNRAYYAVTYLSDKDGNPTNAIFGFVNILNKIIADLRPSHIAAAFDMRAKTFRHKMYDGYKATRKGMPDELAAQMPVLKDLLRAMGIKILEHEGIEADDIIGILAKRFPYRTYIVTGDRDALQLVDSTTTLWLTKKGISEIVEVTPENIKEQFGITAEEVVDFKSLLGDASDNIPGVAGVGEKTALSLIQKYGSLDNVYAHIDEITGALKQKLIDGKSDAYLSKELATIITDHSIECTEDCCRLRMPFPAAAYEMIKKLEFKSLLSRMQFGAEHEQPPAVPEYLLSEVTEIKDKNSLNQLVSVLGYSDGFAFHIDGAMYIAKDEKTEYKIKITDNFLDEGLAFEEALSALKNVLEGTVPKTVFEAKALKHALRHLGTALDSIEDDIGLAAYIHECGRYFASLKDLCGHFSINYATPAVCLLRLKKLLSEGLSARGQSELYRGVELPLNKILYEAECEGVKVDTVVLDELTAKYREKTDSLTQAVYSHAGEEFNLNSPRQLGTVLFDKLKLPVQKKVKTGYSTDNDVLEALSGHHPVIDYIIEYRQISKLLSTYLEGMKPYINSADGKIHTVFKQTLTNTGRLSSTDPNLQNIPIRQEEGREIRRMFVPSSSEHILISADYSQIELRLLAHFSGDPVLTEAYKTGKDIHTITASQVFNMPAEFVTPAMRRSAKAVNFGIIYGISDFGLAKNIGSNPRTAREYIQKYFAAYPRVKEYMNGVVAKARENGGCAETILNRKRKITELFSQNHNIRSFGERAAMNMPLQGSAADIIKLAMVGVYNRFFREGIKSKIILQVHDEIVVDALKEEEEKIYTILREEMTNAVKLNIPLDVEIISGESLYK